jgi:hypothetical protein
LNACTTARADPVRASVSSMWRDRPLRTDIGVEHDLASRVADEPGRERHRQLTTPGLGGDRALQPGPDEVKFGFRHGALEPERQPVVEVGRVIQPVLAADQRPRSRGDLKQPVPVGVLGQPHGHADLRGSSPAEFGDGHERVGISTLGSEAVEEVEQGVRGPVASVATVRGCGAVEHALFEAEIGVQVDAGGALLLMAEPQRDRSRIDAGAEQRHRGGVAQRVHGDALFAQRRAGALRDGDVLGKTPLERVAGERSAGAGGEQRVGGLSLALAHPDAQDGDGLASERGDALFPALAQCPQVRAGTELHVSAGQPQQLGDAQTGVHGAEQQRVVAAAGPGGAVGALEQCLDLLRGEERDDPPVGAFGGDREHPLDQGSVLGMP